MSVDVTSLWDSGRDDWAAACALAMEAGDLAAALFTVTQSLATDRRAARARLSAWAQMVLKQRLAGQPGADALRLVLVHGAGLEGAAAADYYDLQNSDLARVIERGRGMPILLCAVWIIVGVQAGVEVHGVGLPGHFIARVDDLLVDPFRGGRRMSVEDCQAIVTQATAGKVEWDDRLLRPVSVTDLVARVLRNLIGSAQRADDAIAVYRYARLGATLAPDDPNAILTWARAAEYVGARTEAARIYAQICDRFPATQHARMAEERVTELAGRADDLH